MSQDLGKDISTDLLALASHLNISASLGEAPQDYYLGRYPYGHQNSALTLFAEKILPAVVVDEKRKGKRVIIGNSGSLRFDVVSNLAQTGAKFLTHELKIEFEQAAH